MFGIGPLELVVILVVALLVFGPKRVPELARTIGRGLAEFRRASSDLRQTLALDELERDLRRDPNGDKTIHRPESRPAQAGDDVKSGELPLGHDHEHHDVSDTGDVDEVNEVADPNSDGQGDSNGPVSDSKPADPRRG